MRCIANTADLDRIPARTRYAKAMSCCRVPIARCGAGKWSSARASPSTGSATTPIQIRWKHIESCWDCTVIILTAEEARALWPHLAPDIKEAVSRHADATPLFWMELERAVHLGNVSVLMGNQGFGVALVDGDVCKLIAYNGTLREIKLLKDEFVALVRATGCRKIRITGSRSYMRVVPELKEIAVVMEMDIADGSNG